jgi:hypothetical protein
MAQHREGWIMEKFVCPNLGCPHEWPHLHILPLEDVLDFESCDAYRLGGRYGRDCLDDKRKDAAQIYALRTLIEREGFKAGFGVAVYEEAGWIHDGHHRLTVMHDIGAYWCPVQEKVTHWRNAPGYREAKAEYYANRDKVDNQNEAAFT